MHRTYGLTSRSRGVYDDHRYVPDKGGPLFGGPTPGAGRVSNSIILRGKRGTLVA